MYQIWNSMLERCYNKNNHAWADYGGRGITVCAQWQGDGGFERFLADMGSRPSSDYTLDRRDNDGNYEPENCKWSTRKEQARNRRTSRIIEHEGCKATVAEWSEIKGWPPHVIDNRLRRGWTIADALTTNPSILMITHNGKTMSVAEWANLTGIRPSTIHARLERGWTVEDALTRHVQQKVS